MSFGTIDGYEIDAFTLEEHALESEITDYPVESGGDVTDHVRKKPQRFQCTGVVSDTPIGPMKAIRDAQGFISDTVVALGGTGGSTPSKQAQAHFERIHDRRLDPHHPANRSARPGRRLPVVVTSSIKRYEGMVMEKLSISVGPDTGDAFRFVATFKQVRIVTNERTSIRVAVPMAAKKVNLGNKPAKPATPKTFTGVKVYKDSWGGQLAQKLGGLSGFGSGTQLVED